MGKRKNRPGDSDEEDWRFQDEPELPDMSGRSVSATGTGGAASSSAPAPSFEPWQPVLLQLLGEPRANRALLEGRGSILCPFTRRGLSDLYTSSPADYARFRHLSGFNIPADPTSPHMVEGGRALCFCSSHLSRDTLDQHCGPQPGGKTAAIDAVAPNLSDFDAWMKFPKDEQVHYLLRMWLQGKEALAPAPKPQRLPPQHMQTEIVWPPMVFVKFDPRCGINYSSQSKLRQTFRGCSHGYPVYSRGGSQHKAVVAFASADDDNAKGYAMAMACLDETRSQLAAARPHATTDGIVCMELCTYDKYYREWTNVVEEAKRNGKSSWCDGIFKHHSITSVKQYEKAQELAAKREAQRVEAAAKAKALEEERAQRDAERAQWEEERARIDAKHTAQLAALDEERTARIKLDAEYKAQLDQRMAAQLHEFDKHVYELEVCGGPLGTQSERRSPLLSPLFSPSSAHGFA